MSDFQIRLDVHVDGNKAEQELNDLIQKLSNKQIDIKFNVKDLQTQLNTLKTFLNDAFKLDSTQINNLLQSLNLPQDKLSFNLIQFFQQHQIKLNIPLIKKSRAKSKNSITKNKNLMKFEKIQENLAELDLSMELKGFSLSEEELINLLQNFTQGKIFNLSNNIQNLYKMTVQSGCQCFSTIVYIRSYEKSLVFIHCIIIRSYINAIIFKYRFK